ncbi:M24 family metallopeptidase [Desulfococcus multivorans]|uniref:Peptidase M24 n=1 Tax=Desulfococcus multivorans DSM 2059 TaxID=1121405 RepID=S7VAR4_DESML|nr:Xaa-Pro peptidase family protein [Desulfococcus multivorans]AOY59010.1 PepP: Xaa-Pro dipeptidase, M24 family [Desulfococcus multivorans]AQV01272.1 peptidase M24 [Desulfococcus multivorans]EPR43759.1 peptidase M24 [Desulfococcus multivorans DSM 2059]SJZ55412.1 Xaa-Pro aminopeptidase [Desulfococcus multivorans DSM 2059]
MYRSDGKVPEAEIKQRIDRLQSQLGDAGADAALIVQKADLYYFSGTVQDAHLYIPREGKPLLMARKALERAAAESSVGDIVPLKSARQIPEILKRNAYPTPKTLGMELDVLSANLYLDYQRIFDGSVILDVSRFIRLTRMIKSPYEIGILREAGRKADELYAGIPSMIREGIPEVELAGLVEARARKLGHQGTVRMRLWGSEMFFGHLMAGPSAAVPSFLASPTGGEGTGPAVGQSAGFRPVGRNEPIMVDYPFVYQGYISDQTRIFAVGAISDEWLRAQEAMIEIQSLIQKAARPGASVGELYDMAVARAAELGYADHFMGAGPGRVRFIGHGTGLELDEYPFIAKGRKTPIAEGMCIALEPKLIFPGKGVVGTENTHIVTPDGLMPLTTFNEGIVRVD